MNTSTTQAWSQPEQALDPMAQMSSELDDLGNLFEFGDIDLNPLPSLGTDQYADHMQQPQPISHPNTPFSGISPAVPPGVSMQDFGGQEHYGMNQNLESQQYMSQDGSQAPTSLPFTTESMYQPSIRQTYHQNHPQAFQYQQQGFPNGHGVPPTPNSFDMHGEVGRFMQQQQQQLDPQQRALLEQRYQLRKDDAIAYTPMVSPAGTPLYNVQPEFTVPGAYFSPLTSPMLHAQNAQNSLQRHQQHGAYYTNPNTAPNSSATSPIDPTLDIDMDMLGDVVSLPDATAQTQTKRPRRKVATPRTTASSKIRQSPIQKPQKRKSGMLASVIPSKDAESLVQNAQRSAKAQPGSASLQMPAAFNSSEDGSISPEPLSESLMGPPPRPGSSLTQSPAMAPQQQDAKAEATGEAATPKSLLSMRNQQPSADQSGSTDISQSTGEGLADLQLPEAAETSAPRHIGLSRIDTKIPPTTSSDHTPRLSARKTPKLGPLDTPSSARPGSALASPSVVASPMSGSTPAGLLKDRKIDIKGSRSNKKRGSVSTCGSNVVSPALRPRISPSIKPLLPEGSTLHSPTHALLLASKSNYQNLLEGNHLPGVSYPDSLSTGLTSKRTSHKVAEQGRRNRINDALKEMQLLLPPTRGKGGKDTSNSEDSPEAATAADPDSKEGKEEAAAKSSSSKAATVESANIYIRQMQQRDAEREALIARLTEENAEMRKRFEGRTSVASSTEEPASSAIDSASPADVKIQ